MLTKYRISPLALLMAVIAMIAIVGCGTTETVTEQVEVTKIVTKEVEVTKIVTEMVTERGRSPG